MSTRFLVLLVVAWLAVYSSTIQGARAVDATDGWPVLGTLLICGYGALEILILLWWRQTPVSPGDESRYRLTVVVKLATAASAGFVGFALAVVVGPWWLSISRRETYCGVTSTPRRTRQYLYAPVGVFETSFSRRRSKRSGRTLVPVGLAVRWAWACL